MQFVAPKDVEGAAQTLGLDVRAEVSTSAESENAQVINTLMYPLNRWSLQTSKLTSTRLQLRWSLRYRPPHPPEDSFTTWDLACFLW